MIPHRITSSNRAGARWFRWAALFAAVAAAASLGCVTASADAPGETGKKLVVLGDSYSANGFRLLSQSKECLRGPTSWPKQLSKRMGIAGTRDLEDASCSGANIDTGPGYTLALEANAANKNGAFGPRTRAVMIQLGLNDSWPARTMTNLWASLQPCVFNLRDGCGMEAAAQGRVTDYRQVSGKAYADRLSSVIEFVRYYAPRARIVLVGYPELFPARQDTVCVDFLGLGRFVQPRGRAVVEYLDRLDGAQREAARILHVDFLDARSLTAGHGLCSADPWLNGVFDPRADPFGLPFHPSARGDAVIADALYDRISR